jgi:transcriptional regulator with XRE-family HTH domain
MDSIVSNIRRIRESKGYSQDYMAAKLNTTQETYSRMENRESKLKTDWLQPIADALETNVSAFLDSPKLTIHTQTNSEGAYGNACYVENLHVEHKETTKKLIESLENKIQHLKSENEFLRSLVEKQLS